MCCMHSLLVPCIVLCPTVAGRSSRAAAMISCATEVQFRQTCVRICILLLGFDVFVVSARKELAGAVVVLVLSLVCSLLLPSLNDRLLWNRYAHCGTIIQSSEISNTRIRIDVQAFSCRKWH